MTARPTTTKIAENHLDINFPSIASPLLSLKRTLFKYPQYDHCKHGSATMLNDYFFTSRDAAADVQRCPT